MINLSVTLLIRPILIFFLNMVGMIGAYVILVGFRNEWSFDSFMIVLSGLFTCWQAFLNLEHIRHDKTENTSI